MGSAAFFLFHKVGNSRVELGAGSVAPVPPARHVQMTPCNAAQP